MVDTVLIFLGASLTLYAVLGGADFGAGLWEALKGHRGRAHEELVTKAMGPVWEANHVWLIIAVVILFSGFPAVFRQVSITFHVPLTLLLLGITLRGCAFTFRHYDAVQTEASRRLYTFAFEAASVVTPVMLGMLVGGLLLGRWSATPATYYEGYVAPWLNGFSLCVGVFLTALFAFEAAVFLSGEAQDAATKADFIRRARWANAAAVVAGLLVFAAGEAAGLGLIGRFLAHPLSLASLAAATLLIAPLHGLLPTRHVLSARLVVAAQVGLVLTGWFALQYPYLLPGVTAQESAAPAATLAQLLIALAAGSFLLFPALAYLLYIFKVKR